MSSPQMLVSLCVVRIEICDCNQEDTGTMDQKNRKMRGSREPNEITIQTHTTSTESPLPLLPANTKSSGDNHQSTSRENSQEKTLSLSQNKDNLVSSPPDQINFISGNPFVEVTKGILHLFKENTLTEMHSAAERSSTICLLSVPATMTCNDLMTFTAACHEEIQCFRIIRNDSPNQYMALLTFRSSIAASEFYETFNGTPYNSLEPDIVCHLVFVSRVEVTDNGLPLTGHTELPACPVCLEKMDESVDGILTILCNHTFHTSCLVKWGDTSCPVCRFAQTPEPVADSHCMECGTEISNNALWICLICGHIGCGRYDQSHAFKHYTETHHCYAMELGQNRVWDYVSDHWVDRLLQNKDGKMVEGGQEPAKGERAGDIDEKVDSVQLEFTYLLTSQLETQREYFEEKLLNIEQRMCLETADLKEKVDNLTLENSEIKNQLQILAKEKQALEKKLQVSNTKLSQSHNQLLEEKELRQQLELNQTSWQVKHKLLQDEFNGFKAKKEQESTDLQEQVRDLMFFLEAQKQIENSTDREEIATGQIVIPPTTPTSTASSKSSLSKSKSKREKKH